MSSNESDNGSDLCEISADYEDSILEEDETADDSSDKVVCDDLRDVATKCLLKDQSALRAGEEEAAKTVVKLNGLCASSDNVYITDHFNRSVKMIKRKNAAQAGKSSIDMDFESTARFGSKMTQFVGGCTLCGDGKLLVCSIGTNRLLVLDAQTGIEKQRLDIARPQREFHEVSSYIFETADRELLVAFRDTDLVFELRFNETTQRFELAAEPNSSNLHHGGLASSSSNSEKTSSDHNTNSRSPVNANNKLKVGEKSPADALQNRLAAVRLVDGQIVHCVRKRLLAFAYSRSLCYTVCVYTTHDAEICDRQFSLAENVCFPTRNTPEWQPTACVFVESVRTPFILFSMRAGPICAFNLEGRFAYRLIDDLAVTCWCVVPLTKATSDNDTETTRANKRPLATEHFELLIFGFEKRKVESGLCSFGESQKLFALTWSA